MAEVIKTWDGARLLSLPLAGAAPLRGLKKGRPVSAGEALARGEGPAPLVLRAALAGFISEVGPGEIIISRDDAAVGEPPSAAPPAGLEGAELARALAGLGVPVIPGDAAGPLIISAADPEPGLGWSAALFNEHRETIAAGLTALGRLCPNRRLIWAAEKPEDFFPGFQRHLIRGGYPETLPAVLKKRLTGLSDPGGRDVLGGRELFFLGRAWRTGLPLTHLPLSLGPANYFVPAGSRIIDLLSFANLQPRPGDAAVLGGLARGTTTSRLTRGLGLLAGGLHLVRAAFFARPPGPCRGCRACARACPAGLAVDLPAALPAARWLQPGAGKNFGACLFCGACALACPAGRPLISMVRLFACPERESAP
jgi:ferredoxin